MTIFNFAAREITAKIVYYGPGKCGKTTNLEFIHAKADPAKSSKLLSMATETDRTIFFDLLPMHVGSINGFKVKIQLLTVPGQVYYDSVRKVVLSGADGVVFVADSQKERLEENIESIKNLEENLRANDLSYDTIPLAFQLNKQDMSNLTPNEELIKLVNRQNVKSFPAAAINGQGVMETYESIVKEVLDKIKATTGKGVKPLATSTPPKKVDPTEKNKVKVVSDKKIPSIKGELKKTVTPASEHDASGAPSSFKEEDLNEIRNVVNTLKEEIKEIKLVCFELKDELKKTVTTASEHGASGVSSSFKEEDLNEIRNVVNTLKEENKEIKLVCYELKGELKKAVTTASEHDASGASSSFKEEELNEIRNVVNTLKEENKEIKKLYFELKDEFKKTVTTASEHNASGASSSFKEGDLNEIRNDVNTLKERNKKIKLFCIEIKNFCLQIKKRMIALEEKLK